MDKIEIEGQPSKKRSSIFSAFLLLFFALFGFIVIGPYIGLFAAMPFYEGELLDIQRAFKNPEIYPDAKLLIYFMQAGATLGMIIIPALYVFFKKKVSINAFIPGNTSLVGLLLAGAITFTFMGVNAIFIEWNANVNLPDFMSGFENWATQTEAMAAKLTTFLTTFTDPYQLIGALILMAVLPAIAEEFVFRGLVQGELNKSVNVHAAIWVSAVLFSAIHMQFFGFLPRMLLGALFGYLYVWSGNLLIPIFAHFINNGLTLVFLYLYNTDIVEYNIQNTEAPALSSVIIFAIITIGLLFYFHRHYQNVNKSNGRVAEGV
jgi:uncharacterized protein